MASWGYNLLKEAYNSIYGWLGPNLVIVIYNLYNPYKLSYYGLVLITGFSLTHLATLTTAPGASHQRQKLPLDPCHWAKRCSVHLLHVTLRQFLLVLTTGKKTYKRVNYRFHHLPKLKGEKYIRKTLCWCVVVVFCVVVARVTRWEYMKGSTCTSSRITPPPKKKKKDPLFQIWKALDFLTINGPFCSSQKKLKAIKVVFNSHLFLPWKNILLKVI